MLRRGAELHILRRPACGCPRSDRLAVAMTPLAAAHRFACSTVGRAAIRFVSILSTIITSCHHFNPPVGRWNVHNAASICCHKGLLDKAARPTGRLSIAARYGHGILTQDQSLRCNPSMERIIKARAMRAGPCCWMGVWMEAMVFLIRHGIPENKAGWRRRDRIAFAFRRCCWLFRAMLPYAILP